MAAALDQAYRYLPDTRIGIGQKSDYQSIPGCA